MLLAIDIGNSTLKMGVFNGSADKLICNFSISTLTSRTADEYTVLIKQMLLERNISAFPKNAVISSVVPSLTSVLSDACRNICHNTPFIIGTGTKTGFPIKIDVQSQLGADIVSNAAASFSFAKPPFVVVVLGTATTVTAVNPLGQLIATVIAPGASVSLNALERSAALLTDISFTQPDAVIGKNSQDSIRSGAYWGHVFMVDGFINRIRSELCEDGESLSVIGTGGLCEKLLPACKNPIFVVPDLTLIGAASLFYLNTAGHRGK